MGRTESPHTYYFFVKFRESSTTNQSAKRTLVLSNRGAAKCPSGLSGQVIIEQLQRAGAEAPQSVALLLLKFDKLHVANPGERADPYLRPYLYCFSL